MIMEKMAMMTQAICHFCDKVGQLLWLKHSNGNEMTKTRKHRE